MTDNLPLPWDDPDRNVIEEIRNLLEKSKNIPFQPQQLVHTAKSRRVQAELEIEHIANQLRQYPELRLPDELLVSMVLHPKELPGRLIGYEYPDGVKIGTLVSEYDVQSAWTRLRALFIVPVEGE